MKDIDSIFGKLVNKPKNTTNTETSNKQSGKKELVQAIIKKK
jgi:hypothetical protein